MRAIHFVILFLFDLIIFTKTQIDFDNPCECENSGCDCCINILIGEGCIRVSVKNNRIRIAFLWNGDELGGFSTRLGNLAVPNNGVVIQIPCAQNTFLSLRVSSRRNSRFCLNVFLNAAGRNLYNQDFCFNINGNVITNAING